MPVGVFLHIPIACPGQHTAMTLTREKLQQASALVAASDLDVWCIFVRETAGGSDPVLPFLLEGGLTWNSALLIFKNGRRVAVVGNYDADPLIHSGDWDEVIPYVQGIREELIKALEANLPAGPARVGVNFSEDDVKSDGLTHGMFLKLQGYLAGTRFSLVSAAEVCGALRAVKTPTETDRIRRAIAEGDKLFALASQIARVGVSERAVYTRIQAEIDAAGFGYGWDRAGNPIVNSGPDSMIGHGIPSDAITLQPGHIFHIDLGVVVEGYSSDIQRCWYVPHPGETDLPDDVARALEAVNAAISAGATAMRPGALGHECDAAARAQLVQRGYPEYMHALGHQVGRQAHDGGAVLGPTWERYGRTPYLPLREGEIYTVELGITVPGRGYLGLEEMVRVTGDGIEWLSERQLSMPFLGS